MINIICTITDYHDYHYYHNNNGQNNGDNSVETHPYFGPTRLTDACVDRSVSTHRPGSDIAHAYDPESRLSGNNRPA